MVLQTKTVTRQALENQQVYIWQKICLRYFEISQTYFRLSPLYFQFAAGSFLSCKIFFEKFVRRLNFCPSVFCGALAVFYLIGTRMFRR